MLALADTPAAQAAPSFRGSGTKMIGPFRITHPSTARWTSAGPIFQLSSTVVGSGNVNSRGPRGTVYLAPGRYTMQVRAAAAWTLVVVPGVEQPRRLPGGYVGFQGNGSTELPPFSLPRAERVVWRAQGSFFQLSDQSFSGAIRVTSNAHSGSTGAGAGPHQVGVGASGSWTIEWRS